jgi:teichuronic acid biosynthesis glycosyltransferase TuaG
MKFSVIITCYNNADCVLDAVESVAAQSWNNWELIVVDDASTDSSAALLSRALESVPNSRLIVLERNSGGPAYPRNLGVKEATGDWVAFLDADDIWHYDKLRIQQEWLMRSQASFISSAKLLFSHPLLAKSDAKRPGGGAPPPGARSIGYRSLLLKNWLCTSSVAMPRQIALECPFPEPRRYRAIEDYRCWLDVHRRIGRGLRVNAPLVYYRIHEGSISKNKFSMVKKNVMLYREYFGESACRLWVTPLLMSSYLATSAWLALRPGRSLEKPQEQTTI